jgi:serine/threonine-protein kinase
MKAGALIAGKYRLMKTIGKGAMGVVWEATHEGTSRQVAIKLILEPTDELRHRLVREARAYGALRHRNIVEILDVGQTDEDDPFLVMELLTGETLADRLQRQRRLGVPEATRIARDVARALATAHAASIIHRDLKPANIFLHDEPGEDMSVIKVVDFGVSKNLLTSDGLSTVVGGMVGSPAYASPEQAAGGTRGPVDHRADVWSLGVVLFEMLTGVRPLQGDSVSIIPQIMSAEIPLVTTFMRSIDPKLAALVARCLDRDLTKRVASAADLAVLLQGFATASQGSGAGALGQSSSGGIAPPAPASRSDAPVLASPRAPFADAPVLASPRAPFASVSERDPSTRSPRSQGGLLAAGPSMPGANDDDGDDQATAKISLNVMHALRPGAQPAAPPQMSSRAGGTMQMQSDPALPAYRAPMPSQQEVPPAPPPNFKATLQLKENPSFGSGASWPAPTPMTAKLDPSAPWAGSAEQMMTHQGTVRIPPDTVQRIRAGAATAQLAPPPEPPPPTAGLSSVSAMSSLIQPSGGAPSSASQPGALEPTKRKRTPFIVAGSVVGVTLAIAAVVVFRPKGGGEVAPAAPAATTVASASGAPVVSAAAPSATVVPSAMVPATAEPMPSAAPPASAPAKVPTAPTASATVKPAPVAKPTVNSPPPKSTSNLPDFLKKKKVNPPGI